MTSTTQVYKEVDRILREHADIFDSLTAGVISLKDWAIATERALKLGLPWRVLRPQLVGDTQQGMVDYQQWMREFSISDSGPEVTHRESFSQLFLRPQMS